MNRDSSNRSGIREPKQDAPAGRAKTTPNADMQAEDAGTADSGNAEEGADAAEGAMEPGHRERRGR